MLLQVILNTLLTKTHSYSNTLILKIERDCSYFIINT